MRIMKCIKPQVNFFQVGKYFTRIIMISNWIAFNTCAVSLEIQWDALEQLHLLRSSCSLVVDNPSDLSAKKQTTDSDDLNEDEERLTTRKTGASPPSRLETFWRGADDAFIISSSQVVEHSASLVMGNLVGTPSDWSGGSNTNCSMYYTVELLTRN